MQKIKLFCKSLLYSAELSYKSSRFLLAIYFIVNLITPTLSLLVTYTTKILLEMVLDKKPIKYLVILSIIYIFTLLLINLFDSVNKILFNSVFSKAKHLFQCRISEKLDKLPLSYIDSSKGKNEINDVKHTEATAVYTAYRAIQIITYLYKFIVAFVVLFNFNILFSLLFLILIIPGVIFRELFERKIEKFRLKTAPDLRKLRYYRWMLIDTWPAKDIRMYDLTESIQKRYADEKNIYIRSRKKIEKSKTFCLMLAELIMRIGEVMFILFVVYMAAQRQITIGDVTLYIGMATTVVSSFNYILNNLVVSFNRTTREMERLFRFFSLENEGQTKATRELKEFRILEFDNVYFKYPYTDKYILTGVSFTINSGDKLSIVGINGSGKSTIIKLMLGLYKIESGQILINGHPMEEYNILDVRKLFSALFQNYVQYPLTLRENIALSSLDQMNNSDSIENVLEKSGIYNDLKANLENGLDTYMTRQFDDAGISPSRGQWQKIALSRVYFKNAPIIIFDEPSAALDAESEDRIFKNFELMSDGKTGIMISHRISSARISNKIIVIDGGKIIEQGTHSELMLHDGLYKKLYTLQYEKYTLNGGEVI